MLPLRRTPSDEKRSAVIIGSLLVLLVPGAAGACYLSSWNPIISLSALTLTVAAAFALIWRRLHPPSDRPQGPALEALRLSEERYRTLIDTLDVSLCRWLPDTTLVFTNDTYRKIFGIKDETAQQRWLSFLPESARESTAAYYQELINSPRSIAYEHAVTVNDGTLRYYQWIDTPVLDAEGRVVEFESVGIDITERKQAEELVAAQRDLARIGNTVSSCEEAWPRCLEIALRVSGMDSGGIYLFNGEHRALELVYHQGLSESFVREVSRYTTDTPNAQILLAGKPVYVAADVLGQNDLYNEEQLSTAATIPVHYQGRVLGAINIGSHTLASVPVFARHALETISPEIGNLIVYLRTASSLRESEEKYRSLVDSQESALSTLDAQGVFHFINHIGAAPLALSPDHVVGRPLHDFFPPQPADKQLEFIRHVIATGQGMVTEVEHRITGEPRWYHVSIQPLRDAAGTVTLAMVNSRDVTEQKRAAQAQLHYSQQLASVVDIERALAATLDQESIYSILAQGARRLFPDVATVLISRFDAARELIRAVYGCQDGELVDVARLPELPLAPPGQGTQSHVIHTRQPLIICADLKAQFRTADPVRVGSMDTDTQSALYVPMLAQDSVLGLVQLQSYAPGRFTEQDARLLGLVANTAAGAIQNAHLYQELLELNRTLEERVRQRTADLDRAARAKDEFLATMSHELRTPLNAILALSEILLEQLRGPLNERQQNALRTVEASGHHLLALINDILDLSKVEAGQLELTIEPVAIADLCQTSLLFVKEMAIKRAVALGLQLHDLRATLAADPRRLKQMLVNLLSNAVKFTPSGGQVSLEVTVDAKAGLAHFAVQDTGIGIAPDDLARLFQPFSQLDSSLTRQHEGTGLGLALVRRLAELHGGSVMVESAPGKGSRFTLVLPCRPPEAAHIRPAEDPPAGPGAEADLSPAPQPRPKPAKARVLLAEDNEANISAIDDYLQAKGHDVIVARNGLEALRLTGEVLPDVILMDIQMPELDGLEVIRRVRASPEGAATPIIALTALAMPGDRERCLEAGASEYMTKPISLKGLMAAIERLLDAGKGQTPAASP